MIPDRVLCGVIPYGVHSSGNPTQWLGSTRRILLTASEKLLRNRGSHVDRLSQHRVKGGAARWVPASPADWRSKTEHEYRTHALTRGIREPACASTSRLSMMTCLKLARARRNRRVMDRRNRPFGRNCEALQSRRPHGLSNHTSPGPAYDVPWSPALVSPSWR